MFYGALALRSTADSCIHYIPILTGKVCGRTHDRRAQRCCEMSVENALRILANWKQGSINFHMFLKYSY